MKYWRFADTSQSIRRSDFTFLKYARENVRGRRSPRTKIVSRASAPFGSECFEVTARYQDEKHDQCDQDQDECDGGDPVQYLAATLG